MNNIQEALFQTIETITMGKLSQIKFDKTIEAIVVSDEKANLGEYELKYQDLLFTGYSSNGTSHFRKDDTVLVLIPDGDMSKRKTIISSSKNEGEKIINFEEIVDRTGINFVDEPTDFEINLSTTSDEVVSFKLKDELMVSQYPGKKYLAIGAEITTNISSEDRDGTYGIAIDCEFLTDDGTERVPYTFEFNTLNVTGNPYQSKGGYKETKIPLLEQRLVKIVGARAFSKGFSKGKDKIKFKNIVVEYVSIREQDKSEYSGNIQAPKGTHFRNGALYPDEKLPLIMEFKQRGEVLQTDAISYKWFVMNSDVNNSDHPDYHPDAGLGWEWLKSDSYETELIEGVGTSTLSVAAPFVPTFSEFKCIATYEEKDVSVSETITLVDHTEQMSVNMDSSNGVSFINGVGSTTLTCNITQNGRPLEGVELEYEWAQIKEDGSITQLKDGADNTLDVFARNIGMKSNFTCEVSVKGAKRPIATGQITLVNVIDGRTQGVVIVGGFRTVLYDADGNAPENLPREGFQFDVYENGKKITTGIDWTWSIPPVENTLLKLENATIDADGRQTTKNKVLNLGVVNRFDINKNQNSILLEVRYTSNGITNTLRDYANIAITKVGSNGADGAAGKPGEDGSVYVYEIQGGNSTINYDGMSSNPHPKTLNEFVLMFSKNGDASLAKEIHSVQWELPSKSNCCLSFAGQDPGVRRITTLQDLNGSSNNPHKVVLVADDTWTEEKFNNYLSVKFTYNNLTFRETYPISVSKNGATGYTISVIPNTFTFNAGENNIVLENREILINFDVKDGSGVEVPYIIESFSTPSGVQITRTENGKSVLFTIINDITMPKEGTVDFVLKIDSKRYYQSFAFSRVLDGNSPYIITLMSTNGLTFKRGDIQTQIIANFTKGIETVNPLTLQDNISWVKKDKTGVEEVGWVPNYVDGQKHIINISPYDILEKATFECRLDL